MARPSKLSRLSPGAEGKPQYRVVCKRKHNGQRRYFSEGERFESVWNGQVRAF